MNNQRGHACRQACVIHLAVPLLLLLIAAVIIFGLAAIGVIKIPLKSLPAIPGINKQEPAVSLQKQYQNPFDKNTQYINPFSTYQNPFETLK